MCRVHTTCAQNPGSTRKAVWNARGTLTDTSQLCSAGKLLCPSEPPLAYLYKVGNVSTSSKRGFVFVKAPSLVPSTQ